MRSEFPCRSAAALFLLSLVPLANAQSTPATVSEVYCIDGDPNEGYFGTWLASAGDVNFDGKEDFITGAPWKQAASQSQTRGYARVISGADGATIYHFAGDEPGNEFGHSVAGVGDMNGDGCPDFLVGSRGYSGANGTANYAKAFSGADGSLLYKFTGTGGYGYHVSAAGDVNADGHADVIVGSDNHPYADVFSGIDGTLIKRLVGLISGGFGRSVGRVGDMNNDGYDDVAVSEDFYIHIFSGQAMTTGAGPELLFYLPMGGGTKFGNRPTDFNGDGYLDLVVGEPFAGSQNGRISVYSGFDGTVIAYIADPAGTPSNQFGRHTDVADIDGDGHPDIVTCSISWGSTNGLLTTVGGIYAFSGVDFSLICSIEDPGTNHGFGNTVAAINVDGVGPSEIVVSQLAANSYVGTVCVYRGCDGSTGPPSDGDAPIVAITSPLNGAIIGESFVPIAATVDDASATDVTSAPGGLFVSLPEGGGTANGTIAGLVEGTNTLAVTATDSAGNTGAGAVTIIVDTLSPTIELVSPAPGTVYGSSPATVTVNVADASSSTCLIGGLQFTIPAEGGAASAPVALVEGSNVIEVLVTDAAGHSTSLLLSVVLDLTAPVISVDSPLDGAIYGAGQELVAVTATVDDLTSTDVSSTPAGVNTSLPAGGGIAAGAVSLVEGSNPIVVTATDASGRASSSTVTVLLDTTGPVVTLTSPVHLAAVSGTVDFDAVATDALPGTGVERVACFVDELLVATAFAAPYGFVYDTTVLLDGEHTFSVVAYDNLGNESASSSALVLVDNTAPAIEFASLLEGEYVSGTADVSVSASDAGSGLASVEVLVGGLAPTTDPSTLFDPAVPAALLSGSDNTLVYPDGVLSLMARAVDEAGNETVIEITALVDNTAPDRTLVSPTDGKRVKRIMTIEAVASDANLDRIEIHVGGILVGTSTTSPFEIDFDTRTVLDGDLLVEAHVFDLAGNLVVSSAVVLVDNMQFQLRPKKLNLHRAHKQNANHNQDDDGVIANVSGENVDLILPRESHEIVLQVPGGSPVPAICEWEGDDCVVPESGSDRRLTLRFKRSDLQNSVLAGMAAGSIQENARRVRVQLVVDSQVIGSVQMRIK